MPCNEELIGTLLLQRLKFAFMNINKSDRLNNFLNKVHTFHNRALICDSIFLLLYLHVFLNTFICIYVILISSYNIYVILLNVFRHVFACNSNKPCVHGRYTKRYYIVSCIIHKDIYKTINHVTKYINKVTRMKSFILFDGQI